VRRSFPLLLLGLAWFSGCASTGPGLEPAVAGGRPVPVTAPWEIPEAEWRTQRIVLMHYEGPEGNGTLRLVLRFENPERFHVSASDRLGRRWWDLNVKEEDALVLWVRERTFCRYGGDIEIPALSLGPVPAGAVAALLMRRLPLPPADDGVWGETAGASSRGSGVELDFEDRRGRRWTAESSAGGPNRWTLWKGDSPRASWNGDAEGMARLVESDKGLELRWRQRGPARELAGPVPPPEVPAGFRPGLCGTDA
jgi:hypothetical protein